MCVFFSLPSCKDPYCFLSLPELSPALMSEIFVLQDLSQSAVQSHHLFLAVSEKEGSRLLG